MGLFLSVHDKPTAKLNTINDNIAFVNRGIKFSVSMIIPSQKHLTVPNRGPHFRKG
jgi:hypothetical protein